MTTRRLQVDVYGAKGVDVLPLANAINNVLSGYSGTLPDPDETQVRSILRSNIIDFFDDLSRTYRRMLEYMVTYYGD
jgi:hypothetical protein